MSSYEFGTAYLTYEFTDRYSLPTAPLDTPY